MKPSADLVGKPGLCRSAWNAFQAAARRHSVVFFPLMRLRMTLPGAPTWPLLERDTDIVIEGYWRSGNTFAVSAFLGAQGRPVRVASHTHAAATVRRAVRWGTPTLVIARPPLEAVTSRVLLHPHVSPRHALREYIRFHRLIWPYRAGFVRATFDEITGSIGQVVDRVNARFGTAFCPPDPAGEATQAAPRAATAELPWLAALPPGVATRVCDLVRERVRRDRRLGEAYDVYADFCGNDAPAAEGGDSRVGCRLSVAVSRG